LSQLSRGDLWGCSVRGRCPQQYTLSRCAPAVVFCTPIPLRTHFKYDCKLLTRLSHCAKEQKMCLTDKESEPNIVSLPVTSCLIE
jgi:hypothetical protein